MTWIVTRLCRDHLDHSCVEVCPVDCIVEYRGPEPDKWPNQLYIDPEECINCGACETACPWLAIYEDELVPEALADDTALNYKILDNRDEFEVPEMKDLPTPTPEEVAANRVKWGLPPE